MRKSGLFFFGLVLSVTMLAVSLAPKADAGGWLTMTVVSGHLAGGSPGLVVNVKKKKSTTTQQGERSCPVGYVVLDKPNKYGAFCEPKEGLPNPTPAEAEKCKFGMIGTPPNDCHCPAGTEFQGYKGCIAIPPQCITIAKIFTDHLHCTSGKPTCHLSASDPATGGYYDCCCSKPGETPTL